MRQRDERDVLAVTRYLMRSMGSRGAPVRRVSLDELFEWLYRRTGARYIDTLLAFVPVCVLLVVVPGYTALLTSIYDASAAEYLRFLVAYELALGVIGTPGVFIIVHRLAAPAFRWLRGERGSQQAVAAWEAGVTRLPRSVAAVTLWYTLCTLPPAFYQGATLDFPWYGYVVFLATLSGLSAMVGVFFYLLFEQAVRPVVSEVAAYLPERFEARGGRVSLSAKALVLIPAINFFTAVVAGVLSRNAGSPEAVLATVLGLSLLVSLTFSFVLTLMLRNSLLTRIDDLRRAMRRVDDGDLSVRVPPLASDELAELAASFNGMVAGLREREQLRGHNAELIEELQASRARIVAASDAARRSVERDLHDGAQQQLVLLRLKLARAQRLVAADPAAAAIMAELRLDLDRALHELRDLAHGIYPALLENEGLGAALREAAQRSVIPAEVQCDRAVRYPPQLEAAVYFCCLEALQNAAKHAGSGARATVRFVERDDWLFFEVTDDGIGFDPAAAERHAGIANISDRIGALGGDVCIESASGLGTTISGTIPLAR